MSLDSLGNDFDPFFDFFLLLLLETVV